MAKGTAADSVVDNESFQFQPEAPSPAESILILNPDDIHVDPARNLRHYAPSLKSVQELAVNIAEREKRGHPGQLQPVVVRACANGECGGKPYLLLFGYRRVAAIQYINENRMVDRALPVRAVAVTASDEEAMLMNLDENLRRENLTFVDVAFAIRRFQAAGMSAREIGQKLGGKSQAWVYQVAKFAELRPHVQLLIHNGKLKFAEARALSGLPEPEQDKILAKIERGELKDSRAVDAERKKSKPRDTRGRKPVAGVPIKAALEAFGAIAQGQDREHARKIAKIVLRFLNGEIGAGAMAKLLEGTKGR